MDAQNAKEAAHPKLAASSASSRPSDPDRPRNSSSSVARSPVLSRASLLSSKDKAAKSSTSLKLVSQPLLSALSIDKDSRAHSFKSSGSISREPKDAKPATASRDKRQDDDRSTDGNSEAETIVLADGSPAKPRKHKVIKHEEKPVMKPGSCIYVNTDPMAHVRRAERAARKERADKSDKGTIDFLNDPIPVIKKKRPHIKLSNSSRPQDAAGGHSSATGSPPRSRNTSSHPQSGSDTDHPHRSNSPKRAGAPLKDALRPPEKLVSHKRKAPKDTSDDESEARTARRQRQANAISEANAEARRSKERSHHAGGTANGATATSKSSASRVGRDVSPSRSVSPPPRSHRRNPSANPSSLTNGPSALKKKRGPAPFSTDYQSDDSNASIKIIGSKLRHAATPATAESSPAKPSQPTRRLNAHGQTMLARACAKGEFDIAKKRLQERPEDINFADFAGNTPLQIAAINGFDRIMRLLIDNGCAIDCFNNERDTPLLDAVDNGHVKVVQILLEAGANPRKANVNGEEPLDRIDDDTEDAEAIRELLIAAKKKQRQAAHDEHRHDNDESRYTEGADSPRESPAPGGLRGSRRAGTVRANKTSNHLLYMPMDEKTLRQAAGRGDQEEVERILQVRESCDDPEALVAAARGGHNVIMELLLALGRANPDPDPVEGLSPEHATPMLAAIGQENTKAVKLLLEQSSFDPTKRFNGKTYFEIAQQRAGNHWKEEVELLKAAYDEHKKNGGKTRSPAQKTSDSKKPARAGEASEDAASARAPRRKLSSPSQERFKKTGPSAKTATGREGSPRDEKSVSQRRSDDSTMQTDEASSPKRGSSTIVKIKPRDDRSSATTNLDRDTPPPSKQTSKSRKTDSESVVSSDTEASKPKRKKLISGRDLRDEKARSGKDREKEKLQRRSSMATLSAATPSKESSSPHEIGVEDGPADHMRADKHRDRARQLKKEDSKESSPSGDGTGKRHRPSDTPPVATSSDKESHDAPVKRRKLDSDAPKDKEKKPKSTTALPYDDKPAKGANTLSTKPPTKHRDEPADDRRSGSSSLVPKAKKRDASTDRGRRDSFMPSPAVQKSIRVKFEYSDVDMTDVSDVRPSSFSSANAEPKLQAGREEEKKKAEAEAKDEEAQRALAERKQKEEEKRRLEAEEAAKQREEEEKKKQEAEEKRRKEAEEKRRKDEEERRKRKEEERRLKEEEEAKKREAEEEKKRVEEEQRKKREEQERLRKEQLAREAAAAREAQLKREEEERQKREQERLDRLRAEREAEREAEERRRALAELERERVVKLPPLLRWLSTTSDGSLAKAAPFFKALQGVRYDCIDSQANDTAEGREQWLFNVQVALLLGDKDLELSKYPSWRHVPAASHAKTILWNLESDRYALTDPTVMELGSQLPGFYGAGGLRALGSMGVAKLRDEASQKFFSTDMFFVKVSDVMAAVATLPHLRDVRIAVEYRELPETEAQLLTYVQNPKWKHDPDADKNLGFAPGTKYFVNGVQVDELRAGYANVMSTPPPVVRVPRRGLFAVGVDDPQFEQMCMQINTDPNTFSAYKKHKAKRQNSTLMTNGHHANGVPESMSLRTIVPPGAHVPNGTNGANGLRHG